MPRSNAPLPASMIARERVVARRQPMFAACFGLLVLLLAAAASVIAARPVLSAEYLVGPQDQIRFKVYEWRVSRDEIFEWTALNDAFTVGPDGTLSLPFAGTVAAEGYTTAQIAEQVGETLMRRMGLGRAPDVSAEIMQYRPFYMTGDVQSPGEFPYRPDLNVMQAVSIAGGLVRADRSAQLRKDVISARGEMALQHMSRTALRARKARLQAEIEGAETISFPPDLEERKDTASVAGLLRQETSIFDARREGLATQVRALEELGEFLERSAESLEAHTEFQDRQVALTREELENVESLVEKGFAAESRKMEVERALVRAQSDRLAAETALMQAKQELSQTKISMLELNIARKNEVRSQLRDTEAQIEEVSQRYGTTTQLLNESFNQDPQAATGAAAGGEVVPVFRILRSSGDRSLEFEAEASDAVQPGDVIEVLIRGDDTPATMEDAAEASGPDSVTGTGIQRAAID